MENHDTLTHLGPSALCARDHDLLQTASHPPAGERYGDDGDTEGLYNCGSEEAGIAAFMRDAAAAWTVVKPASSGAADGSPGAAGVAAATACPAKTGAEAGAKAEAPAPTPAPAPARPIHAGASGAPDFSPAPRQRVSVSGWTAGRQYVFITSLADTGSVTDAAMDAGMSPRSAYQLRRSAGAESFARAWDLAIMQAARMLTDIALERAINGTREPVYGRDGQMKGMKRKLNDRLLMFLLRHHRRGLYGIGAERVLTTADRAAAETWDAGHSPLPDALAALASREQPVEDEYHNPHGNSSGPDEYEDEEDDAGGDAGGDTGHHDCEDDNVESVDMADGDAADGHADGGQADKGRDDAGNIQHETRKNGAAPPFLGAKQCEAKRANGGRNKGVSAAAS